MKIIPYSIIFLIIAVCLQSIHAEPLFEKMSDHCFMLHIDGSGENIAVIVTGQGILLFDPPPEPDLSIVLASLKKVTDRSVRWLVNTGHYLSQTAGTHHFLRQGAVLLSSSRSQTLPEQTGSEVASDSAVSPRETLPYPQFVFGRWMFLYPDDLEIQIQALQFGARTGADIFTYIPGEKVLLAGRLFEPASYPDIDVATGGSAIQWVDALKLVIDSVPLLISAIPPERPVADVAGEKAEEGVDGAIEEDEKEKSPEEMILVISARGGVSNLKDMKEMLATSKGLRTAISNTIKAGRSCEQSLDSPEFDPYRIYGNFYNYAGRLCEEYLKIKKPGARSQEPEARIKK